MRAQLVLASCVAQVLVLYYLAPWPAAAGGALLLAAVLGIFAFSAGRWDAHLDMILAMLGPGGLGMLLPLLWSGQPGCLAHQTWQGVAWMTVGMLALGLPFAWGSRCLILARRDGVLMPELGLHLLGMTIGMLLGHLPALWLPMAGARMVWLHHGLMLAGMNLGMMSGKMAARAAERTFIKLYINTRIAARQRRVHRVVDIGK